MARRALATVDLGAIEHNARRLAQAAREAQLCAVVKADGYGHGAVQCARAVQRGGAQWLAVATAREAAVLREAQLGGRILVMGALTPDDMEVALGADADVVAWEPWQVEALRATGRRARVHVKLDTGMGRLGTRDAEQATAVADAVAANGGLELAGAMTHFATADDRSDPFMDEQLALFEGWARALAARHTGLLLHASNSAATLREPRAAFGMVRCGVALYGLDPFGEDAHAQGLRPALELRSYVAAVKPIAPGQSTGYGRRFVADRPGMVATVPIGYGDGVRRGLGAAGFEVLARGRRRACLGTVSMDNITVEGEGLEAGDEAVLIGEQEGERVSAEEWARRLDTINYEITCGLTPRVEREYAGGR